MFTFVYQAIFMTVSSLQTLFKTHKESRLHGRYIFSKHILPLLEKHQSHFDIDVIGQSVLGESIHAIKIGTGKKKIFMWSQMHGNESTTTKALFDLCNVFANATDPIIEKILTKCTIVMIPMLNPDGAKAYTRVNANDIDLNRDAQDLSQPESKILKLYFDGFRPEFCFNLHGQRTIFSAGKTKYPATVSFLAPAQDELCTVTPTRKKAMELIVKMNEMLQLQIPNQVGIYDDAFNINCVGDTFQSFDVPTVLFEAGHFKEDYDREVVREFIFQSLVVALEHIATQTVTGEDHLPYFEMPQNHKLFYDIILRQAIINGKTCDVAIQYQETLVDNHIEFKPIVEKISDLNDFYGHKEVNVNGAMVYTANEQQLYEGYENDFVLMNNEIFALKL